MIYQVEISKMAQKDLKKVPTFISMNFYFWVRQVEKFGLEEVRKQKGYHDEPLKGERKGQRSVRLNNAYRAIYTLKNGKVEFIEVLGINKHEY